MRKVEHNLQVACVEWFRLKFPQYKRILLSFPNMGQRSIALANYLKAEGMTAGAPDLIFLKSCHGYSSLAIEMKTSSGRQSEYQKQWQKDFEDNGGKYVVCRSTKEFLEIIRNYLYGD